ncbi:MAG: Na+/H+ antiporter [Ferruginibacter sp.]|nr:Na+/H+ antiporter [Cytophagales bacterium]
MGKFRKISYTWAVREIELFIVLLAIITALAEVGDRVRIPYPILLVLAGIAIGSLPGLPHVELNPEVVFLVFLPPLLYAAAWSTSWPDFKAARRPISLLALGCVLFTTTLVAVVAHQFIPGFDWPTAFVLGAIISPPDAVAATTAIKGLGIPRRVVTVLEGESLVNDATGLIAYRYAIAAVLTGQFVLWQAGVQFLLVAGAGIATGLAIGWLIYRVHLITPDNPVGETSLTFLTPYVAYLAAEELGGSGVLAVVAAGLFLSWRSAEIFSTQTRLQAYAVWNTIVFLLNGVVFILIGLQLPAILAGIGHFSPLALVGYGALVSGAVIVGRLLWVYPGTYLPRWASRQIREREPDTTVKLVTVVAWTGMRGVVSLAAALALPLTVRPGVPFPQRDLILFLTFCVIFSTLVLQGLSLPLLIRWLGIQPDGREAKAEWETRLQLAYDTIEYIEGSLSLGQVSDEVLNQIKTKYEIRIQRLRNQSGMNVTGRIDEGQIVQFHQLQADILRLERDSVGRLRKAGRISDETLRRLEYELDLEESRLLLEKGEA